MPLKKISKITIATFLVLVFSTGTLLGSLSGNIVNKRFETYTEELAKEQLAQNTLSLHYTLADPSANDIEDYQISLGKYSTDSDAYFSSLENERCKLTAFLYEDLSKSNQLTYDILKQYYDTELSEENQYYLMEPLSPSLGIQAQLPILLAEYTFRNPTDFRDYFYLLKDIPAYFDSIISFEKEKFNHGYFMSNKTADRIIEQCTVFLASKENYLQTVFETTLLKTTFLTEKEKNTYQKLHQKLIDQCVLPAYQTLIRTLTNLKSDKHNQNGLYYLEGGKEYYTYLLKSHCGIYDSVEDLQSHLGTQLNADYQELHTLLSANPSLASAIFSDRQNSDDTPEDILISLQEKMKDDFPTSIAASYEIKYIDDALQDYASPAFYLTPPIDQKAPNLIYLNSTSNLHGIELFTTLAHEGFPGHLYQTQYFMKQDSALIRHLLNLSGYVEGWATYIESYAYEYGASSKELGRVLWLDRSINLCIYSLLDIGIHYYGWKLEDVTVFLKNLGIKDTQASQEIFQYIVETPANYLKYYGGCLKFLELREAASSKQNFSLIAFHENILKIGPCQFPILQKYLLDTPTSALLR